MPAPLNGCSAGEWGTPAEVLEFTAEQCARCYSCPLRCCRRGLQGRSARGQPPPQPTSCRLQTLYDAPYSAHSPKAPTIVTRPERVHECMDHQVDPGHLQQVCRERVQRDSEEGECS